MLKQRQSMMLPYLQDHGRGFTVFAALATLLCASALPDPFHRALGAPENDIWNHLWGYQWVYESLLSGKLPLHTTLLNWPSGGTLWFIDSFNALLTLPIQAAFGVVAAYNAGIWLNLFFCGAASYFLALQAGGEKNGAIVAGIAYMSTPQLLGQIYNGISETVSAGWLPFSILVLLKAFADPTRRHSITAGLVLGITALANWYYGLFAGLCFGGMLISATLSRKRKRSFRTAAIALLTGSITFLVTIAGPYYLFSSSMSAPDALVTRDLGFVWMTLVMHNMTDLVSFFRPGKVYSPDLKSAFDEDLIVVVYVRISLLIGGGIALFSKDQRKAEPWLGMAAAFFLLALGPFLYVGGKYISVQGGWVPLPFLALFQWFPAFSRISHAYRFVVGVSLGFSIAMALSVAQSTRLGLQRGLVAAVLGALLVGECLFFSQAVWPIPVSEVRIPAVYKKLTGGAVLDLPVVRPVLARAEVLAYQLVHRQPIPFGLNDPIPKALYQNHFTRFLVEVERQTVTYLPAQIPVFDLAVGAAALSQQGLRWIVVHRKAYTEQQKFQVIRFLDMTLKLFADDGEVRVYQL
jgi:hypothetical protein